MKDNIIEYILEFIKRNQKKYIEKLEVTQIGESIVIEITFKNITYANNIMKFLKQLEEQ
jgi:hypothetical protein